METIAYPARAVLEGVPRVHFWDGGLRCPEDVCFPATMRAVMEYLGENIGCQHCVVKGKNWGLRCSYSFFNLVSGTAFTMNWKPGWSEETFAVLGNIAPDPVEPFRQAFKAVGYGWEYVPHEVGKQAMLEKIRASIYDHRRPVISFGVVGPPEAGIITGYDEGGDVLLGWSFFQSMPDFMNGLTFEPPGESSDCPTYYRKTGWYEETQALLVVGEKGPEPSIEATYLTAFRSAVEQARRPEVNGMATGLAAYDAWAADLLEEAGWDSLDEAELRRRHQIHDFLVGQVAEWRWYGSQALINGLEKVHIRYTEPMAEPMLKAASCLAGEHEQMWKLWDLAGGNGSPDAWRSLANPGIRREMAAVVQASKERYAEAADTLEQGLKKI